MSETSTPYTPASTSTTVAGNETVSLADEIKKYDTAKLIEYLQGQEDLGLSESALKILENEEIRGSNFLDMTEQKFRDCGLKIGPAVTLAKFAKDCKEKKLRSFSSYLSLSEVLAEYGYDSDGIDSISLFSPPTFEIRNDNEILKRCMEEILGRLRSYGTLQPDSLEAMRNEYI